MKTLYFFGLIHPTVGSSFSFRIWKGSLFFVQVTFGTSFQVRIKSCLDVGCNGTEICAEVRLCTNNKNRSNFGDAFLDATSKVFDNYCFFCPNDRSDISLLFIYLHFLVFLYWRVRKKSKNLFLQIMPHMNISWKQGITRSNKENHVYLI